MAIDRAALAARLTERLADLDAQDALAREAEAPVVLDQEAVGRLSRVDALQMQAMARAAAQRRARERQLVHSALARLDSEEFGWCVACGEPIGEARLSNDPTVLRCIGCAA